MRQFQVGPNSSDNKVLRAAKVSIKIVFNLLKFKDATAKPKDQKNCVYKKLLKKYNIHDHDQFTKVQKVIKKFLLRRNDFSLYHLDNFQASYPSYRIKDISFQKYNTPFGCVRICCRDSQKLVITF